MSKSLYSAESCSIAHRLHIDNLWHSYGSKEVLRGVNLDAAPGEILCLAGPSGCGKSTLLRLIAGIEPAQAGVVSIDGERVSAPGKHTPPEKRGIGLVFQDFALFPHMSVEDNIAFGVAIPDRIRRQEAVQRMLARVGLADYGKLSPHMLSGGQQQRVAFARALASQPKLILLDEPFSSLDVRLRHRMRSETQQLLKESGISSIMVTHDPEDAMFMADRIALMNGGRIVQLATPDEIYHRPVNSFAAEFFGDVNRFCGRVEAGGVNTPLGWVCASMLPEGTLADVLVRPEAIKISDSGGGGGGSDEGVRVSALVSRTRFLGATSLVNLRLSPSAGMEVATDVQALLPGDRHPLDGARLHFKLDANGVFVFAVNSVADSSTHSPGY